MTCVRYQMKLCEKFPLVCISGVEDFEIFEDVDCCCVYDKYDSRSDDDGGFDFPSLCS